jgi:hypothetical protein
MLRCPAPAPGPWPTPPRWSDPPAFESRHRDQSVAMCRRRAERPRSHYQACDRRLSTFLGWTAARRSPAGLFERFSIDVPFRLAVLTSPAPAPPAGHSFAGTGLAAILRAQLPYPLPGRPLAPAVRSAITVTSSSSAPCSRAQVCHSTDRSHRLTDGPRRVDSPERSPGGHRLDRHPFGAMQASSLGSVLHIEPSRMFSERGNVWPSSRDQLAPSSCLRECC